MSMLAAQELEALANALTRSPNCKEAQVNACRALRAIADQRRKSEPVAWLITWDTEEGPVVYAHIGKEPSLKCFSPGTTVIPLYTTPLADAEAARRYKWLRDEAGETFDGPYIAGKRNAPFAGEGWLTGEHADEAIDQRQKVTDEIVKEGLSIIGKSQSFLNGGRRVSCSRGKWFRLGEIFAALQSIAQPVKGEVVVTKDEIGNILAITRQDKDGRILEIIAEAPEYKQ